MIEQRIILIQVRVVEFNASTPFREQLEIIASSAVLVSVHTSNLANAQFLQPGSAVVELIQRNWIWHSLDRSFQVRCSHTRAMLTGNFAEPCYRPYKLHLLLYAIGPCVDWHALRRLGGLSFWCHAQAAIRRVSGIPT